MAEQLGDRASAIDDGRGYWPWCCAAIDGEGDGVADLHDALCEGLGVVIAVEVGAGHGERCSMGADEVAQPWVVGDANSDGVAMRKEFGWEVWRGGDHKGERSWPELCELLHEWCDGVGHAGEVGDVAKQHWERLGKRALFACVDA